MTQLFCTPEQGARLKELLPELTSEFLWVMLINHETHLAFWHLSKTADYTHDRQNLTAHPALTLQELRDLVRTIRLNEIERWSYSVRIYKVTAPELADWIIMRLEVGK